MRYGKRLIGLVLCIALMWASMTALPTLASDLPDVSDGETTAVVAVGNIYKGTRITRAHLKTVSVDADMLPEGAISNAERAVALYARVDMYDGQYITEDMLAVTAEDYVKGAEALRELDAKNDAYLCVSDYVRPGTGEDLADVLQSLILANPNRTLYFPDGEYLISHSLATPAAAAHSVTLRLSDGAVIKARGDWHSENGHDSLIALGGAMGANDVRSIGSYYLLTGGTLDGSGVADGVSIASGRESVIRNICIKDTKTGIYVDFGANNTSSDCDFEDITIIGSGKKGSVGVNVIGADNTFTNIRIYDVETGFIGKGGGHVNSIFIVNTDPTRMYRGTVGVIHTGAFMSNCYIENYETAFAHTAAMWDCSVVWNNDACKRQVVCHNYGVRYLMTGIRVRFHEVEGAYTAFTQGFATGADCLFGVAFDETMVTDTSYKEILGTSVVCGE